MRSETRDTFLLRRRWFFDRRRGAGFGDGSRRFAIRRHGTIWIVRLRFGAIGRALSVHLIPHIAVIDQMQYHLGLDGCPRQDSPSSLKIRSGSAWELS
jgi:hypothetical protein